MNSPRKLLSRFFKSRTHVSVLLILCCAGIFGCEDANAKRLSDFKVKGANSRENRDPIREAFKHLRQLIRLDRSVALREIQYELNTWSMTAPDSKEWKSPSLLESISASLRTIDFSNRMTELKFGEPECEYLLQCQMMRDVSKWVVTRPYQDNLFKAWLQKKKAELSQDDWLELETTLKLFDWAVCNIGIDGQPKDVEKLVTNPELPLNDQGPVYRLLPWQAMTYGRGEAWQRARVFSQLAFSQNIETIVLALPSESGAVENASLRLWCVGVPIGSDIYLFEPTWGLPIPSQANDGIATLREAKENPAVLRRAKIPGFFEYPVEQKDLNTIIALVDVEPFAVGKSMSILEKSLTGDSRMRISLDADALEERLNKIDPKLSVRLWNVPWLTHVYNQSVRQRLNEQSPFSMNHIATYGAYISDTPISRARTLHLNGTFDTSVDQTGALRAYMDIRVDEQTLKELEFDKDVQAMLGVVRRQGMPIEQFQLQVEQAKSFYRRSKFDVAMFLAMASFANGKADTAADWLSKRLLAVQGTDRWHAHAHYLLGRAYEMQGNSVAAVEEYKFENSPQAAGNRIRIRKLNVAEK